MASLSLFNTGVRVRVWELPTSALDAPARLEIVARVSESQNQFSLRQNSSLLAAFFIDGHSKRGQPFKRRTSRRGSESGNQAQIGRHSGAQSRIGAMNPFLQRKPKRQRTGAVQDLAEARNHVALACVLECGSPLSPLPLSDERFMESLLLLLRRHGDHELISVGRARLRRALIFVAPKEFQGSTESRPTLRFMGSPHFFFETHWDHEPCLVAADVSRL